MISGDISVWFLHNVFDQNFDFFSGKYPPNNKLVASDTQENPSNPGVEFPYAIVYIKKPLWIASKMN